MDYNPDMSDDEFVEFVKNNPVDAINCAADRDRMNDAQFLEAAIEFPSLARKRDAARYARVMQSLGDQAPRPVEADAVTYIPHMTSHEYAMLMQKFPGGSGSSCGVGGMSGPSSGGAGGGGKATTDPRPLPLKAGGSNLTTKAEFDLWLADFDRLRNLRRNAVCIAMDDEDIPLGVQALVLRALRTAGVLT